MPRLLPRAPPCIPWPAQGMGGGAWLKLKRIRSLRNVASERKRSMALTAATCFSSKRKEEERIKRERERYGERARQRASKRERRRRRVSTETANGREEFEVDGVMPRVIRNVRVSSRGESIFRYREDTEDSFELFYPGALLKIPLSKSPWDDKRTGINSGCVRRAALGIHPIILIMMKKANHRISAYSLFIGVFNPDPAPSDHRRAIQFIRDARHLPMPRRSIGHGTVVLQTQDFISAHAINPPTMRRNFIARRSRSRYAV